jgi:Asp-tRNA(Asn)/Glu-tRNA(Gln) amidotransferase A subunit family amidase
VERVSVDKWVFGVECEGWTDEGMLVSGMKASGSSSGCAVGVALGLCGAAIGTEVCSSSKAVYE